MRTVMALVFGGTIGAILVCAPGPVWERLAGIHPRCPQASSAQVSRPGFVLVSAALFGLLGWQVQDPASLIGDATVGMLLLLIALLDLRYRVVPNRLIFPAAAVILAARLVHFGLPDALNALWAGMGALGLFLLAAWVSPGGLGGGDIKLAAVIGFISGFPAVMVALVVAVMSGGLTAVVLILSGRRDPIPYAPFLCLGALIALVWNPIPWLLAAA